MDTTNATATSAFGADGKTSSDRTKALSGRCGGLGGWYDGFVQSLTTC